MKTILTSLFAVAAVFAFNSCEKPAATADTPAEAAVESSDYPLTTCVISGEELGSMGEPVVMEHEGTKVKLCCDHCIDKFKSDPAKYGAMVKDAEKKAE